MFCKIFDEYLRKLLINSTKDICVYQFDDSFIINFENDLLVYVDDKGNEIYDSTMSFVSWMNNNGFIIAEYTIPSFHGMYDNTILNMIISRTIKPIEEYKLTKSDDIIINIINI